MLDPLDGVYLHHSSCLDSLGHLLGNSGLRKILNKREIARRYVRHKKFSPKKSFPYHHYLKNFKDISVKIVLDASLESNGYSFYPFLSRNSKSYLWCCDDLHRVYVYLKSWPRERGGIPIAQYENLLEGDLLTIVESSVCHFPALKRDNSLVLSRKIEILEQEFERDVGYILIVPQELRKSWNAQSFLEHGGILVNFPYSCEEFCDLTWEIIREHELRVKVD